MFGTIGHFTFEPANRAKLDEVMARQAGVEVDGFVGGYVLYPEGKEGEAYLMAIFSDRDAYYRNADDPAQHERYTEYRALLNEDPTWTDGQITSS